MADHLLELFGFFEPLATRSIIVPEFTWRGETQEENLQGGAESEADESVTEAEEADDVTAPVESAMQELKATIDQQFATIQEQGDLIASQRSELDAQTATVEALSERLEQAEEALALLGETNTRLQQLEGGLSAIRAAFGIEEELATERRLPSYAALFDGGFDLDLNE